MSEPRPILERAHRGAERDRFLKKSDPKRVHLVCVVMGFLNLYSMLWWAGPEGAIVALAAGSAFMFQACWITPTKARRVMNAIAVIILLFLSVGYQRCPHGRFLSIGRFEVEVIEGQHCGNARKFQPIVFAWLEGEY